MIDVAAFLGRLRPAGASPVGDTWRELEDLVAAGPHPERLRRAYAAGGIVLDEDQAAAAGVELELELRQVAPAGTPVAVVVAMTAAVVEHVAPADRLGGGLSLAEELDPFDLPAWVLPLARDLAAHHNGLAIIVGDLDEGTRGRCQVLSTGLALVFVDRSVIANPVALAEVLAHELAHALDDDCWRDSDGIGGSVGAEAFAYALTPLLLEHEPESIADARPLIDQVLAAVAPYRTPIRRPSSPTRGDVAGLLEHAATVARS